MKTLRNAQGSRICPTCHASVGTNLGDQRRHNEREHTTARLVRKSLWTRIQEAAPEQGVTITQEDRSGAIAYRIVNNETGTDYGLFTPGETASTLGIPVLA